MLRRPDRERQGSTATGGVSTDALADDVGTGDPSSPRPHPRWFRVTVVAMLERVISAGQSGVDQVGWRMAEAFGIPTGGAMPRGFLTEEAPRPEYAETYGAVELATASYPARTERNVRDSDATIRFGTTDSPEAEVTFEACLKIGKSSLRVEEDVTLPSHVVTWLRNHNVLIRDVASEAPDLGGLMERFLGASAGSGFGRVSPSLAPLSAVTNRGKKLGGARCTGPNPGEEESCQS